MTILRPSAADPLTCQVVVAVTARPAVINFLVSAFTLARRPVHVGSIHFHDNSGGPSPIRTLWMNARTEFVSKANHPIRSST